MIKVRSISRRTSWKHRRRVVTPHWHDFQFVQESQIAIGWDEDFCARFDTIAKEGHSHVVSV